ncbi:hypothetical protein GEMRC1_004861 [Eukaryota sp. GEM-RC1]
MSENLKNLENVHSELLYSTSSPTAGRYSPQNELLFNSGFNVLNNTNNHGLNYLVNNFILICTQLINQEVDVDWDFDAPIIQEAIDTGRLLTTSSLDSLDVYFEELSDLITTQRWITTSVLMLVFVTSIAIYFVIFRNMLNTLRDEEEISSQLISMIPQAIIDSNKLISDFVDSKL